jgi:hypothetical protein
MTRPHCPKCTDRYLKPDHRRELSIHIIRNVKRPLVCIHEVQGPQLAVRMGTIGYGCAPLFASERRRPEVPIVGAAIFFFEARPTVEKTITA